MCMQWGYAPLVELPAIITQLFPAHRICHLTLGRPPNPGDLCFVTSKGGTFYGRYQPLAVGADFERGEEVIRVSDYNILYIFQPCS